MDMLLKQFLAKGIDLHETDNNGKNVFELNPKIAFLRAGLKVSEKFLEENKEKYAYEQWKLESNVSAYDAMVNERRDSIRAERTQLIEGACAKNSPKCKSF